MFPAVNEVYRRHFPENPPARILIDVPAWNGGFDIEVDCIAAAYSAAGMNAKEPESALQASGRCAESTTQLSKQKTVLAIGAVRLGELLPASAGLVRRVEVRSPQWPKRVSGLFEITRRTAA